MTSPNREGTAAERAEYLEGGLVEVTCARCGVTVRAKKNSPQHTSVQWSRHAVELCTEFADRGEPTALIRGCGALRESIERTASKTRFDASATVRP